EKYKARLWAEAIARKAKLVRYTKDLFTKLAEDQRKKVNVYAQSTKFLVSINDNDLITFFNDIITGNTDIPAILTTENGEIVTYRNIDLPKGLKTFDDLPNDIKAEFSMYPPILVDYKVEHKVIRNYIHYKDSNLFKKQKQTLNDLVETYISEIVLNTASAPVILTDEKMNVLAFGNIDSSRMNNQADVLKLIKKMKSTNDPVVADLGEGVYRFI